MTVSELSNSKKLPAKYMSCDISARSIRGPVVCKLSTSETDDERDVLFRELVDRLYEIGKAVRFAEVFEIDDVIDPVDTRRWITTLFDAAPPRPEGATPRPNVDTW